MISAYTGSNWNGLISATLLSIRGRNLLWHNKKKKSFYKTKPKKGNTEQEDYVKNRKLKKDQAIGVGLSQSYDVLLINVSGENFVIPRYHARKWPHTLLGSEEVEKYYRPELGMYFFDRNRAVFEHIVRFYQTDTDVEFPNHIDKTLLQMELDFFKIGWRDLNVSLKSLKFEYHGVKEKAFAFFNDHQSSVYACSYMILELVFILVSVAHFIVEESPSFISFLADHPSLSDFNDTNIISYLGLVFFSIDFVARLCVSLDRIKFFKDVTTWFDIIALLPYYIDLHMQINYCDCDEGSVGDEFQVVMILKIFRIARCFKIIRRSERLRIIIKILGDCMSELTMMLLVWIIGILVAGSIGYITENSISMLISNESNSEFYSILESTWWAQITMSSIGYGDMIPDYPAGQFAATIIILGSTILTSIPMTFIIRRFSLEYEKVARRDMPWQVMGSTENTRNSRGLQDLLMEKSNNLLAENATYSPVIAFRKSQAKQKTILDELVAGYAENLHNEAEDNEVEDGHMPGFSSTFNTVSVREQPDVCVRDNYSQLFRESESIDC